MSVTRQLRGLVVLALMTLAALALSACSPQVTIRGSAPSDEDLVTLRRGLDTKEDIQERFGRPITLSAADPDIWYYVQQDLRPRPLNPPEIIDQRIVVLRFDEDSQVQNYEVINGIIGDVESVPDSASSKIYGPDRSPGQALIRSMLGTLAL